MNIALVIFAGILIWMRYIDVQFLGEICKEDGVFENTQAVLYFLSGLGFLLIFFKKSKNLWHLALFILFIVLAGEEISWGQRIFHILASAWELKYNVQAETNLHNLNGIHQHIRLVGTIFIFAYFLFVPILNKFFDRFSEFFNTIKLPIYPILGQLTLMIALIFMVSGRTLFHTGSFRVDEIGELYISMGMFFFFLSEYCNTALDKNNKLTNFVYVFCAICIFLGVYIGILNIQ